MAPDYKRPFYIIGHNPNTVELAHSFLKLGANALEPDIIYTGEFYVSHDRIHPRILLTEYLAGLRQLLTDHAYNLALITFDLKDTDPYDINDFLRLVKENFSGGICDGVAIVATIAKMNRIDFVTNYDQSYPNIGIATDQTDDPEGVEQALRSHIPAHRNIVFADGSFILNGLLTKVVDMMERATSMRYCSGGNSFQIIYAWVVRSPALMSALLDIHVDGLLMDEEDVPQVLELLNSPHYAGQYELARNGYNPYEAKLPPYYRLTIKTKDILLAGTDSLIQFTLQGENGVTTKGGRIDGRIRQKLERGTTCELILEGIDIGVIKSLTIEVVEEHGLYPEWLPESITVESNLWEGVQHFRLDESGSGTDVGLRAGNPLILFL